MSFECKGVIEGKKRWWTDEIEELCVKKMRKYKEYREVNEEWKGEIWGEYVKIRCEYQGKVNEGKRKGFEKNIEKIIASKRVSAKMYWKAMNGLRKEFCRVPVRMRLEDGRIADSVEESVKVWKSHWEELGKRKMIDDENAKWREEVVRWVEEMSGELRCRWN